MAGKYRSRQKSIFSVLCLGRTVHHMLGVWFPLSLSALVARPTSARNTGHVTQEPDSFLDLSLSESATFPVCEKRPKAAQENEFKVVMLKEGSPTPWNPAFFKVTQDAIEAAVLETDSKTVHVSCKMRPLADRASLISVSRLTKSSEALASKAGLLSQHLKRNFRAMFGHSVAFKIIFQKKGENKGEDVKTGTRSKNWRFNRQKGVGAGFVQVFSEKSSPRETESDLVEGAPKTNVTKTTYDKVPDFDKHKLMRFASIVLFGVMFSNFVVFCMAFASFVDEWRNPLQERNKSHDLAEIPATTRNSATAPPNEAAKDGNNGPKPGGTSSGEGERASEEDAGGGAKRDNAENGDSSTTLV